MVLHFANFSVDDVIIHVLVKRKSVKSLFPFNTCMLCLNKRTSQALQRHNEIEFCLDVRRVDTKVGIETRFLH